MKIFKESATSELFQLRELTGENLIAFNDMAQNYRNYLEDLLKKNDTELVKAAPGVPALVRNSLLLQINTCKDYEKAFLEVMTKSDKKQN